MRKYIGSIDERKDAVYESTHPFFSDIINIDNTVGLANFSIYEYTDPTHEFLYSLSPKLGKGIFNTSYRIFAIRDFLLTPPYDKYNFQLEVNGEYVEYKKYCQDNKIEIVFSEEEVYFITDKQQDFPSRGVLLLSTDGTLSFVGEAGTDTIKLSENLYIKSKVPFITVIDETHPLDTYQVYNNTLGEDGTVSFTDAINNRCTKVDVDEMHALSELGIAIYDIDGAVRHTLIDIPYYSWNKSHGIVDIGTLENNLATKTRAGVVIKSLHIFTDDLSNNSDCCKLKPSEIFKEYMEFVSLPKYHLENLINDASASLVPLSGQDPRLLIDYGNDKLYFDTLKTISRRITRELINAEYSKIRNDIDLSLIGDNGLSVQVMNRYSQEVSIFINGHFYHGEYTRQDTLGLSKISIAKEKLDVYGEIKHMEICVEPLFTKRYDLVKNGIIQYGDMAGSITDTHKNLIPVHSRFNAEQEVEVYVNGYYLDESFYHFELLNTHAFIFIDKNFTDDINDVTVITNAKDIYDKKYPTYTELSDYSILDEQCKVFYRGQLVPIKHMEDLYNGKYINVEFDVTGGQGHDNEIILLQYKDNPHWGYLEDANASPLLNGFIHIEDKKVTLISTEQIYNHIKVIKLDNILVTDSYPLSNYSDDILQRTMFLYEYISIGKILKLNCNGIAASGSVNDIQTKYPSVVRNNKIIIDCNQAIVKQSSLNNIYDGYRVK